MYDYPLVRINERALPSDYDGPVFIWDVDKTYLDTDFKSLGGLMRIPLEMAIDKQAIPGTAALLAECRRGPGPRPRHTPLYFVSASPPQLAGVIQRKMTLDGLQPDGFVFKDQLKLVTQGRLAQLKRQVEYKLTAHLGLIADLPRHARLVVVGDDWESDAQVFSLLDRILRGELEGATLARALRQAGVRPRSLTPLVDAAVQAAGRAQVWLALLLLTRGRDPSFAKAFSPPVRTAREALQAAALFAHLGLIAPDGVARVAGTLRERWGWTPDQVAASLTDAAERQVVPAEALATAREGIGLAAAAVHAQGTPSGREQKTRHGGP